MVNEASPSSEMKSLKVGDRIWHWLAASPTWFESRVADLLTHFETDTEAFHVEVFPWLAASDVSTSEIRSHIPSVVEVSQSRCIGIVSAGKQDILQIPKQRLAHTAEPPGAHLFLTTEDVHLSDRTFLVVGTKFDDHVSGYDTRRGAHDTLGFLCLMFGFNVSETPSISCYFNVEKRKFVAGDVGIFDSSPLENVTVGLKSFYGIDAIDFDQPAIHQTLWFAGRAFRTGDPGLKVVLYQSAFESVWNSKRTDDIARKMYKRFGAEPMNAAHSYLRQLKLLRNNLLHQGASESVKPVFERILHLILLDALVLKSEGELSDSGFVAHAL